MIGQGVQPLFMDDIKKINRPFSIFSISILSWVNLFLAVNLKNI